MDGSERENVCFMDLAKMIIKVCECGVCPCWLAASHILPALQTEQGFGRSENTNAKFPVSIYVEVKLKGSGMSIFVEKPQNKKEDSLSFCPRLFPLCPPFSFNLQMNGTLCSDKVSRLPNEVSNYEPCYFLCSAGCDRGKEGTQREEEEGGI